MTRTARVFCHWFGARYPYYYEEEQAYSRIPSMRIGRRKLRGIFEFCL